ncbi:MAG: transcriptional antiterminator, partial [Sporolactobacillus laevolacticus]|nr:transcriptional antiterminator [Sporolactobacillus laevolacticus]
MNMENLIQSVIRHEDPKNPLTDQEISEKSGVLREIVTKFRKTNGIPDSRERRKGLLLQEMIKFLSKDVEISERGLTELLKDNGFRIARYAVKGLKEEAELLLGAQKAEIQAKNERDSGNDANPNAFDKMIGYDGSLKEQVGQAKAAVIYPPHGLNTLILGPSGAGKSFLAELMHHFAVETNSFSEDAPFMTFNCADYANNPQLLLAQLFGYKKGAFTGANEDKKGIVELCNHGILFLDEIHRLPA